MERAFLVEGRRAIADMLSAGVRPDLIVIRHGDEALVDELSVPVDVPVRRVTAEVFSSISGTVNAQGVIASVPKPNLDIALDGLPLILVVDGVRDPGNMGTLLRSAAAAGASAVFVGDETVDPYSPKVVRSAMGAHFRVPLRIGGALAVEALDQCDVRVLADAESSFSYDEVDWTQSAAVVIGGEAMGAGERTLRHINVRASIPMAAGVESLNAGVAGGVVLFEAARQRRRASATNRPTGSTNIPWPRLKQVDAW